MMTQNSLEPVTSDSDLFTCDTAGLTGPIGAHHYARFFPGGAHLLVHFATAPQGMGADQHFSALEVQARQRDWSLLVIIAEDGHDFRGSEMIDFFDMCSDDAVFEGFDEIVFYGDAEGGYAALCYGLCATGSRIVAVTPLPPTILETDRYLPVAENLAVAAQIVWVHDPTLAGALEPDPAATVVKARYLAPNAERGLIRFGVFWPLLEDVMGGTFDQHTVYEALRARRDDRFHVRRLSDICRERGQYTRAAIVLGSFARRKQGPRFAEAYNDLIDTHGLSGLDPI